MREIIDIKLDEEDEDDDLDLPDFRYINFAEIFGYIVGAICAVLIVLDAFIINPKDLLLCKYVVFPLMCLTLIVLVVCMGIQSYKDHGHLD